MRSDPNRVTLGHGYKALPYDLPVAMSVSRHMGAADEAKAGLIGHTLAIDAYTFGAKVEIKFVRGKMLVITLDGKEIARKKVEK